MTVHPATAYETLLMYAKFDTANLCREGSKLVATTCRQPCFEEEIKIEKVVRSCLQIINGLNNWQLKENDRKRIDQKIKRLDEAKAAFRKLEYNIDLFVEHDLESLYVEGEELKVIASDTGLANENNHLESLLDFIEICEKQAYKFKGILKGDKRVYFNQKLQHLRNLQSTTSNAAQSAVCELDLVEIPSESNLFQLHEKIKEETDNDAYYGVYNFVVRHLQRYNLVGDPKQAVWHKVLLDISSKDPQILHFYFEYIEVTFFVFSYILTDADCVKDSSIVPFLKKLYSLKKEKLKDEEKEAFLKKIFCFVGTHKRDAQKLIDLFSEIPQNDSLENLSYLFEFFTGNETIFQRIFILNSLNQLQNKEEVMPIFRKIVQTDSSLDFADILEKFIPCQDLLAQDLSLYDNMEEKVNYLINEFKHRYRLSQEDRDWTFV